MQLPEHGANPLTVYTKLGLQAPVRVIDFSENVNPAGPPEAVMAEWQNFASKLTAYPDPNAEPFTTEVAKHHKVEKSSIFVGNGAAELLSLLAERYRGRKAIIVHPTFSEYEATLLIKNVAIIRVVTKASERFKLPLKQIKEAMESASVLYLCTPNNPTGIMPSKSKLDEIIKYGREVECEIILDEAFIDFIDESRSYIGELINHPHVIVVRSMTKMYAIPGIRLGYVVAHSEIIQSIKAFAPHWNVNGIAAEIGVLCLREIDFQEKAIAYSTEEVEKIKAFFETLSWQYTDASANFISFTPGNKDVTKKLYEDMLAKGIVLRHTENFVGMDGKWLRTGMKSTADMDFLKKELSKWFADN